MEVDKKPAAEERANTKPPSMVYVCGGKFKAKFWFIMN